VSGSLKCSAASAVIRAVIGMPVGSVALVAYLAR
jgi:hypothetical protein